ncbi:uncharacterized protein G2W53_007177 [Senna tora]|uniref:Uncharacterized protein n=1 Tax=Senna tora TaxID=362788 RepID=A0A835CFF2_9FABA|nr:uncharacterized protein G2W53_007177 [Senna tora]
MYQFYSPITLHPGHAGDLAPKGNSLPGARPNELYGKHSRDSFPVTNPIADITPISHPTTRRVAFSAYVGDRVWNSASQHCGDHYAKSSVAPTTS